MGALTALIVILAVYLLVQMGDVNGMSTTLAERNIPVIDLTLTVKNTEMAEAVCKNWQEQSPEVYACLMDMLVK